MQKPKNSIILLVTKPSQQQRDLADKVKDYFSADKSAGHLDKPLTSLYIQFMGQKQKGWKHDI